MEDARSAPRSKAAVELEHVSKQFGAQKILKDVTLQVATGNAFCLLGRSGIGKSVTLKIMIGLIKPDHGRVLIEGRAIQAMEGTKLESARRKIGFLFQNGALFDSISVFENVAFPLRRHTQKSEHEIREIVEEKLKEVELGKEGRKMPAELSGGMTKRAALARALALDPAILLIDEPSSGLDRITANEIYELLLQLKKNKRVTMVVVTHDVPGAARFADCFAVLNDGHIIACGTVDDLARSENQLVRDLVQGSET